MAVNVHRAEPVIDIEMLKGRSGAASSRLDSIDLVRGIVMVVMALDHVRDFLSYSNLGPRAFTVIDPEQTTPAYFFTRWITHFCAPTFVFLAGTGAFLSGGRGKSKAQLSWFLLSRGLWLALLEVTVVHLSWTFKWDLHQRGGAVIWAIGWSMVGLSILVWLPTSAVAALGVAVIAFHNQFDSVPDEGLGRFGWLWHLLHQTGPVEWLEGYKFDTPYPVLPWLGVMAAGYGLGAMLLLERPQRRRQLFGLGLTLTGLFIVLRYLNRFGDPKPWQEQPTPLFTVFSILNCEKYPPSLMFVLMTLGPSITALALFDRPIGWIGRPFVIFGRVPLFFYLLHLPLIHGLAVAVDYYRYGWSPISGASIWQLKPSDYPADYGLDLPEVYAIWAGVVLILFPLCYGFMLLKRRYPGGILSYL